MKPVRKLGCSYRFHNTIPAPSILLYTYSEGTIYISIESAALTASYIYIACEPTGESVHVSINFVMANVTYLDIGLVGAAALAFQSATIWARRKRAHPYL